MTKTHEQLVEAGLRRRAVEAAVWAMPAVNFEIMRSMMAPEGGTDFLYWSKLLDWRNQTLTPNADLIYYMAFMDVGTDGPLVLEIPPGEGKFQLNGNVCTLWQLPLEDVGRFGADKGEGGRYLILPPGYEGEVPEGYIVLRSDVRQVYALLRTVLPESTQQAVDEGLEFCKNIRIYPLSQADNPPEQGRRDLHGVLVDTRIPYDIRFWEALDRVIQAEPWLQRDRVFAEQLAALGIKRGQPFEPDAKRVALLESALEEARLWLRDVYENEPPFFEGTHWFFPAGPDMAAAQKENYADPEVYPYTDRGVVYHMAFIGLRRLGSGQFYLVALHDSDGEPLRSDRSYRMRVPAGVPVSQYWSVAMYDGEDHTFIRENTKYSVPSNDPALSWNDDGSVDIYFGPTVKAGMEANSITTGASTTFELMFRFYGVTDGLFEKRFQLNDLERIDSTDA